MPRNPFSFGENRWHNGVDVSEFGDEIGAQDRALLDSFYERSREAHIALLAQGVWRTAREGGKKLIEMEDSHLSNIMRMYEQGRPPFEDERSRPRYYKYLIAEVKRRIAEDPIAKDRFNLIELD